MPDKELKQFVIEEMKEMKNKQGCSWEDIGQLSFAKGEELDYLHNLKWRSPEGALIERGFWGECFLEIKEELDRVTPIKLSERSLNSLEISSNPQSNWSMYKKRLQKKNWTEQAISEIAASSYSILKQLGVNTIDEMDPVKGLVVGNVQSGKTANMAGLMAMAADNGFNFFIVLTGTIENLRQQTEDRLVGDMKDDVDGENSNSNWQVISKPSLNSKTYERKISNINLSENSNERFISVNLKNKSRLKDLLRWLYSDQNKCKQLKILVIDDEADQASINTKDIFDESDSEQTVERTAINDAIHKLLHGYNGQKVQAMNYISYTATPYANLLNENGPGTLYPSNFIVSLKSSPDYIGPKEIFGIEEPEERAKLDIVRSLSNDEIECIKAAHERGSINIPDGLKEAVNWYILTLLAARAMNYKKPITMLIHTSFKTAGHEALSEIITNYIVGMRFNDNLSTELQQLYLKEQAYFKRTDFLSGMPGYSNPENVMYYPDWSEIEIQFNYLFSLSNSQFLSHVQLDEDDQPVFHDGIHLAVDNSSSRSREEHVRLVYPEESQKLATGVIVIGGNTLSRGLTLEGLTTSYFLRTTKQVDTLMQMGRWFGYRKGYELLPRIWLEQEARLRFEFISQINQELKEEIEEFSLLGKSPTDFAPKVKNSPNHVFLRITAGNKMQNSKDIEFDFGGFNKQTVIFENNKEKLDNNILAAENLFKKIEQEVIVKPSSLVWNNVPYELIKEYINNYQVNEHDVTFSKLPELLEWLDTENSKGSLNSWSVILASKGQIKDYSENKNTWQVHGKGINKVIRSVRTEMPNENKVVSIGALRSPSDLLLDINQELLPEEKSNAEMQSMKKVRKKYSYENTPQLLIYMVDKAESENDSSFEDSLDKGNIDKNLNFSQDIIGMNIMIPSITKGGGNGRYLQQNIKQQDELSHED